MNFGSHPVGLNSPQIASLAICPAWTGCVLVLRIAVRVFLGVVGKHPAENRVVSIQFPRLRDIFLWAQFFWFPPQSTLFKPYVIPMHRSLLFLENPTTMAPQENKYLFLCYPLRGRNLRKCLTFAQVSRWKSHKFCPAQTLWRFWGVRASCAFLSFCPIPRTRAGPIAEKSEWGEFKPTLLPLEVRRYGRG